LPIPWSEIDAWARRTGRDLTPWECRVLTRLDDATFAPAETPAEKAAPKVERAWPSAKVS
jgi:hypothetical protein